MDTFSFLFLGILLTCSVFMVHGKCVVINDDIQDQSSDDILVQAKLPGACWACKWALNKVKKAAGNNATVEGLKTKLLSVCDQIGFLKSKCRSLIRKNLGVLIEELTTTDDVKTICVNIKACKSKEFLESPYEQNYIFQNKETMHTKY